MPAFYRKMEAWAFDVAKESPKAPRYFVARLDMNDFFDFMQVPVIRRHDLGGDAPLPLMPGHAATK